MTISYCRYFLLYILANGCLTNASKDPSLAWDLDSSSNAIGIV